LGDARVQGFVSAGTAATTSYGLGAKAVISWGECSTGSLGGCAKAVLYTAGSTTAAFSAVKALNFTDQFGPRPTSGSGSEAFDQEFLADNGLLDINRISALQNKNKSTLAALDKMGYRINGDTLETPKGNFPNTDKGLSQAFTALGGKDGAAAYSQYKSSLNEIGQSAKNKIIRNKSNFVALGGSVQAEPAISENVNFSGLYSFEPTKKKKEKKMAQRKKKMAKLKRATASDYKSSPMGQSFEDIFDLVQEKYKNADQRQSFFQREYE